VGQPGNWRREVLPILEVGDADFAGVEAVAGEVAEEGEEGYAREPGDRTGVTLSLKLPIIWKI